MFFPIYGTIDTDDRVGWRICCECDGWSFAEPVFQRKRDCEIAIRELARLEIDVKAGEEMSDEEWMPITCGCLMW